MIRPSLCIAFAVTLALTACDRHPERHVSAERVQDSYRQPEQLIAALALRPGDAVAEVGAGGGYLTGRLAAAVGTAGRVVATDIDAEALAALRTRAAAYRNIETRRVSASDPGLSPDTFDLILLAQVDHLLPDRLAYLRALRPSLRAHGRIAVSNRERYREELRDAAISAEFSIEEVAAGLPAQFLMVLRRR